MCPPARPQALIQQESGIILSLETPAFRATARGTSFPRGLSTAALGHRLLSLGARVGARACRCAAAGGAPVESWHPRSRQRHLEPSSEGRLPRPAALRGLGRWAVLWRRRRAIKGQKKSEHDAGMATPREPRGPRRRPWSAAEAELGRDCLLPRGLARAAARDLCARRSGSAVRRDARNRPCVTTMHGGRAPKQRVSGSRPPCHDGASCSGVFVWRPLREPPSRRTWSCGVRDGAHTSRRELHCKWRLSVSCTRRRRFQFTVLHALDLCPPPPATTRNSKAAVGHK